MSYSDMERRLYWRNQKREEYARKRGFDSWAEYLESKRRAEQLRFMSPPTPVTPPWQILGWTRRKYRKWLNSLVKKLPTVYTE